ncbi:hypothetical protein EVAR_78442_1 [Eumeta japonica]|uniref:Regulatory protein zeste n=1 Tax=Eumeta variegata TaxID=151549 RepID=A0A4C1TYS6_EUMVA|nr:hypothetical protein EVAR_78442_1 [Eumeta japonica]
MDIKHPDYNDVTCRVIALLCDSLNASTNDISQEISTDNNDSKKESEVATNEESWIIYSNDKQNNTDNAESDDDGKRINRALNFTPQECKLLLQCVKPEKKYVFSKLITAQGLRLKNQAWERKVKQEVSFNDDKLDIGNSSDEFYKSEQNGNEFILDPLSTVLNEHETELNVDCEASSSKEVNRFQIELVKYKLETAKLERRRVEAALKAEKEEREIRDVENALRLRAARLNAVAAEMGLPPGHHALQYAQNEIPAKNYLTKGLENSIFN